MDIEATLIQLETISESINRIIERCTTLKDYTEDLADHVKFLQSMSQPSQSTEDKSVDNLEKIF